MYLSAVCFFGELLWYVGYEQSVIFTYECARHIQRYCRLKNHNLTYNVGRIHCPSCSENTMVF
jgi:hypothetical protein